MTDTRFGDSHSVLRAPFRNEMHWRAGSLLDARVLRPGYFCLPDLTTYLGFVAAVLMMQAVPGPDTILVAVRNGPGLANGPLHRPRNDIARGADQLPLLVVELGGIARAFRAIFEVIQLAGAAYLVWLGLSLIFRATSGLAGASLPGPPSPRHAMIAPASGCWRRADRIGRSRNGPGLRALSAPAP